MKITIELLSDICIGSGESYNSVIDTDVTYDDYGLPYIPAKRIKGCIREAGLELKDFFELHITYKELKLKLNAKEEALKKL